MPKPTNFQFLVIKSKHQIQLNDRVEIRSGLLAHASVTKRENMLHSKQLDK